MPVSDSMMGKFKDFRRAKRGAVADRIHQGVGGTAETLRTGESAVSTFGKRDPQLYRDKLRQEFMAKQEAKMGITKDLQREEQFYYSREQEERLAIMSDIQERLRMEIQMAQRDKDRAATSAAQAAANKKQVKLQEIQRDVVDYTNNIERMLPATAAAAEALTSSYGLKGGKEQQDGALAAAYLRRIDPQENDALLGEMMADGLVTIGPDGKTPVPAPGVTSRQMRARMGMAFGDDDDARRMADADARAEAQQSLRAEMSSSGVNPQQVLEEAMNTVAQGEFTDAQKYQYMMAVAGKLHIPLGLMREMVPNFEGIEDAYDSERQVKQTIIDVGFAQAEEIAGRTYAGDAERPAGLSDLKSAWDQAKSIASDSAAERRGGPAEGEEGYVADPDAEYAEMMGVPGLKRGVTAADRMVQTLDLIEQYPDKPVMQTLRDQIMASPEFAQFKKKMNYGDDMFAFREMNRMARKQHKATRISDRKQRANNMRTGLDARKAPAMPGTPQPKAPPAPPKKPEAVELVQGNASRVAEE